ncbi:MAG: response regulator transcription factor [Anaerosomatales bacterium]|nr:response regulator transcription factor [Anaerosomatales bacterium]
MSLILVVEDDPIVRTTVEYALKRAGFDVLAAEDGSSGLDLALARHPDLILLDLMLPGIDGYRFAEQVRQADPDVAIIMVTALDQPRDKVRGLDAGADDYVTKPFSMDELLARIRANLRRVRERRVLEIARTIEVGDLVIKPNDLVVTVDGRPAKLRLKEFQLLVALASNPGALMSRERLSREVWGYEFMSSSRTIDVHIRRLRQAIEEPSRYRYIHTVHGVGYRFEPRLKSEHAERV